MLREPDTAIPRILVVEDSFLMAEVVCNFVRDCGLLPIGPAHTLDRGLQLARAEEIDAAVLDINLQTRRCFPICTELARRHVPFVFLTGYAGPPVVPSEFRARRYLEKPFLPDEFQSILFEMVGKRAGGAPPATPVVGLVS